MNHTGRNAPCPCGSGKKYKRCCLRRKREAANVDYQRGQGPSIALDWLMDRYPDEVDETLWANFFGGLFEDERETLGELPVGLTEMVQINSSEWLLAEGEIEVDGDLILVSELLLGPGGPPFEAEQRRSLEDLCTRSMSLYEVEESRPGEGLRLRDTLNREPSSSVWVEEKAGSRSFERGDVLGARLIPGEPWALSGALYPIPRETYLSLREEILGVIEECECAKDERESIAFLIGDAWLKTLVAPLPELIDSSSGESILLVTDHYEVQDWDRLENVLAEQPDVDGDRSRGWTRFEEMGDGMSRALFTLVPIQGDRLEFCASTLEGADAERVWLEDLAGDALVYRLRELVDPMSTQVENFDPPTRPSPGQELPPEEKTALIQTVYKQIYRNWPDEPIPALGDATPRQAVADQQQRGAVIELLRTYEFDENKRAKAEGREPASFGFLWKAVGLSPEELGSAT